MSWDHLTLALTSAPTTLEYDITVIQETRDNQSKDAFSVAPPGLGPTENILLGISGMQGDIEIRWPVHDDGTDKSNGTVAEAVTNGDVASGEFSNDTVVTLAEQRKYLKYHIHEPTFAAEWTLDHENGAMYENVPVFVESLEVPGLLSESPKWLPSRMQLRVGSSSG